MNNDKITARRELGSIIIDIPEDLLISAVEGNPDFEGLAVTDREKFLNFVADNLIEEIGYDADTGIGLFYRLLDQAAEQAAESDEGVKIK
jgi:hypothetical protein